jgi:hypothetical protein
MCGLSVDLKNTTATDAFIGRIRRQFPRLNVLISNAGIMRSEDLTAETVDLSAAHATIYTNIVSLLHVAAGLLPVLRKQLRPQMIDLLTSCDQTQEPDSYGEISCILGGYLRTLRGNYQEARRSKERLKRTGKMCVDQLQLTTVLLPLLSAGCYPDGNSPTKHPGKQRKTEPKMGFKSPPEQRRKLSRICVPK